MPDTTITLTPAQAQRLINTYCYVTEPEPDAVERLTRSETLAVPHAARRPRGV